RQWPRARVNCDDVHPGAKGVTGQADPRCQDSASTSPLTLATYVSLASSELVPANLAHASYFARPTKSVKPGRGPVTSPSVACLYHAYSSSLVALPGSWVNPGTAATADSKSVISAMSKD